MTFWPHGPDSFLSSLLQTLRQLHIVMIPRALPVLRVLLILSRILSLAVAVVLLLHNLP